jgi:hypothetical protein
VFEGARDATVRDRDTRINSGCRPGKLEGYGGSWASGLTDEEKSAEWSHRGVKAAALLAVGAEQPWVRTSIREFCTIGRY